MHEKRRRCSRKSKYTFSCARLPAKALIFEFASTASSLRRSCGSLPLNMCSACRFTAVLGRRARHVTFYQVLVGHPSCCTRLQNPADQRPTCAAGSSRATTVKANMMDDEATFLFGSGSAEEIVALAFFIQNIQVTFSLNTSSSVEVSLPPS